MSFSDNYSNPFNLYFAISALTSALTAVAIKTFQIISLENVGQGHRV